ncbi:MAG: hypothetical protein A3G24_11710 [Betaproteobacteria bacterium RIFCSPLOWO2_12_FULL_62_13]|nr:MAG: hypothetical protein A3G24_11710 [Betaproteobacteria bacterium RIFCSPLOWO2_12_FULL_62_13]
MKTSAIRIAGVIAVVVALAAVYWLLQETGVLATILDGAALRQRVVALGAAGPLAVIALMVLAIMVSPIPSAPIAVAAGAAYGHGWGMLYVLLGAELGALAAFGLARLLGRDTLQRWFGDRLPVGWLGSQNVLMAVVFASRLVPFISFDVVSYAAGLTALSYWRFAIATLAGITPASFLLAHVGSEMATGEFDRMMYSVLALGLITLVPVAWHVLRQRLGKRPDSPRGSATERLVK